MKNTTDFNTLKHVDLHLRLDPDVHGFFRTLAFKEKISLNQAINTCLKKFTEKYKKSVDIS